MPGTLCVSKLRSFAFSAGSLCSYIYSHSIEVKIIFNEFTAKIQNLVTFDIELYFHGAVLIVCALFRKW